LLIQNQLFSQSLSYKVNAGLNITNFKYSITDNGSSFSYYNDNRTSYFIGFGVEKPVDIFNFYNFLLNAELQYSQQGNTFYSPHIGRQSNVNNQLNLLLSLKAEVIKNICLGLGGYAGFLVYVDEYYREDEETHKNFDLGLIGSVEYKFLKKFSIEAKYLYGLSDILNREFDNETITHDKVNRVIQIGLNYRF
tara:strand:+ start:261 stop:839 length:579 start_codon:yes stop_codon:yes gene_type:complete